MIIIYLHGFRSTGNSGKTQTLKAIFPKHRVIGCDYSPHCPSLANQELRELIATEEHNSDENIVVIGTSLGGFWARWMAKEFGIKALLINPSLHPDTTLPTGSFEVYDTSGSNIHVTQNDITAFKAYKVNPDQANDLKCTVWVAMNDELLDAKSIIDELDNLHDVVVFESGGHRFSQFAEMKTELRDLIEK